MILLIPCLVEKAAWYRQGWQYRLELPKLCYHPWMAADDDMVSHVLSHVLWWKKKIYIYIYASSYIFMNLSDHPSILIFFISVDLFYFLFLFLSAVGSYLYVCERVYMCVWFTYIYIYIYSSRFSCPVSWGYRIHQLHLCRGVRHKLNTDGDAPGIFAYGECGVSLDCYRFLVHSGLEW